LLQSVGRESRWVVVITAD